MVCARLITSCGKIKNRASSCRSSCSLTILLPTPMLANILLYHSYDVPHNLQLSNSCSSVWTTHPSSCQWRYNTEHIDKRHLRMVALRRRISVAVWTCCSFHNTWIFEVSVKKYVLWLSKRRLTPCLDYLTSLWRIGKKNYSKFPKRYGLKSSGTCQRCGSMDVTGEFNLNTCILSFAMCIPANHKSSRLPTYDMNFSRRYALTEKSSQQRIKLCILCL